MAINFIDQSHGKATLAVHNDAQVKRRIACSTSVLLRGHICSAVRFISDYAGINDQQTVRFLHRKTACSRLQFKY
jgi:hypothetical protein